MSHIHIPDGVLPAWLWLSGFAVTVLLLTLALVRLRGMDAARKVPLLGVTAALMVVTMSAEIVPIAYHVNLTVLAGVLMGPALGFICAFIVDVVLALLGHGGVTVIGLNTLVVGSEITVGWLLVKAFTHLLGPTRLRLATGVATVLTLAISATAVVGLVAVARIDPAVAMEGMPGAGASHSLSVTRFAAWTYGLGAPGWVIEAFLVSFVVGFIAKVRPDLVGLGPAHPLLAEPVGDHGHH